MATVTEEPFYFILIDLNITSHMWLLATSLDRKAIGGEHKAWTGNQMDLPKTCINLHSTEGTIVFFD